MSDPSLVRFRAVIESALVELEARRQEVNDLNVFPVADGDTGDNMALTLRAVLDELDRLAAEAAGRTIDEIGREEIVSSVARAALLGARGNSGVILSQLIRGATEELISRPGELVDPVLIGAAMARAVDQAYGSVREPAEGTILTVVREMAHRVAIDLPRLDGARLDQGATVEQQNALLAEVLENAVAAGQESVRRGPEMLPVLRDAGVVDAGGYGLTVLFAGVVAALRGSEPPALDHHAPARVTHPDHVSDTYRYCTNFAVTGGELDPRGFSDALERIGDSVLVVGDHLTLKVHVHTDDPDAATALFAGAGSVSRLDVADMRAQAQERAARLAGAHGGGRPPRSGALAVCSGAAMAELFAGVGVLALEAGAQLNPSTYELLAGIHGVHAEEVVVLTSSPDVVMAAERAAELSERRVRVVATGSQQASLAVAVGLDPQLDAAANATALGAALGRLRTGGVAPAARDDARGRFVSGQAVGFEGDEIVAWGEPTATLRALLARLGSDAELLTCIAGDGAPLSESEVAALAPDGAELELRVGGQPTWWWLIAAE